MASNRDGEETQDVKHDPNRFQFGISTFLWLTAAVAVVLTMTTQRYYLRVVSLSAAFLYLLFGPLVIVFTAIAFCPEKDGQLIASYKPLKVLFALWLICLFFFLPFVASIFL